ncbi:hypothetical protein MASR1M31_10670 [Porphyromonadaceae bacterium]
MDTTKNVAKGLNTHNIYSLTMFTYDQLLLKLKKELQTLPLSGDPKKLYEPINYELSLGGKRTSSGSLSDGI